MYRNHSLQKKEKKEILDLLEKQNKVFVPDLCDFLMFHLQLSEPISVS